MASPDTDTVVLFGVAKDRKKKLGPFPVQDEPWGVAILPDASKTYVANTASEAVARTSDAAARCPS